MPEAVVIFEDGEIWYIPIDHTFFPKMDALQTYVDESPNLKKKQLNINNHDADEKAVTHADDDDDEGLKSKDPNSTLEDFNINKIYHAQCLEYYPKHFVAFVRLSTVDPSSTPKLSKGNNMKF